MYRHTVYPWKPVLQYSHAMDAQLMSMYGPGYAWHALEVGEAG